VPAVGVQSRGIDSRFLQGEAREDFAYSDGAFANRLDAGGKQGDCGIFALRDQPLTSTLYGIIGARLDYWSNVDGHQIESNVAAGTVLSDSRYAGESGSGT
jgi:hypothetical protein